MERVAEKVINMIEEQAHTSGLTDRVRDMLATLLGREPGADDSEESENPEIEESEPEEETKEDDGINPNEG
jgi:exosome complex component RRP4